MWKNILPHFNSKYTDKRAQMAACLPRRDRAEFKTQHHKRGGKSYSYSAALIAKERWQPNTVIEQPDKAPDISHS